MCWPSGCWLCWSVAAGVLSAVCVDLVDVGWLPTCDWLTAGWLTAGCFTAACFFAKLKIKELLQKQFIIYIFRRRGWGGREGEGWGKGEGVPRTSAIQYACHPML